MKKLKKSICTVLAVLLISVMFTGCSNNNQGGGTPPDRPSGQEGPGAHSQRVQGRRGGGIHDQPHQTSAIPPL